MKFAGTERVTVELDGTFEPTLALPAGLDLDLAGGRARVSLFAFHVDGLGIVGVPFGKSTYSEVIWRVAVRRNDTPAWWVVACDLSARLASIFARRWVRYPVREVPVDVRESSVASGGLSFRFSPNGEVATVEERALLTGALWEIPWGDDAQDARRADVTAMTDTAGRATVGNDITWSATAIVRRGRLHRCGTAKRVW